MTPRTPEAELRYAEIVGDLVERLGPICSAMPHADFMAMVHDMATIQLKYELRAREAGTWGNVPDRLP